MPAARVDGVRLEIVNSVGEGLRIYHPENRRSKGALLWIHGGGFVIGRAVQDDRLCMSTAAALGLTVVSVEYRLAPRHPFPAAVDDCLVGWDWLQRSAAGLGIDRQRVAIGGISAGGGLAASLIQRVHDRGGERAAAQWLFCPMLDDRTAARRELDGIRHFVWNNARNTFGWRSFLNSEPGSAELPRYASAARRKDLRGLPPAWIGVGEIDIFYDEDRIYAERLRSSGAEVTFVSVPGAPHGFEVWAAQTDLAKTHIAGAQRWLETAVR
jgi:acetyl esterase/lipase